MSTAILDDILFILQDGEKHSLQEIMDKVHFPVPKILISLTFLFEQGMIVLEKDEVNSIISVELEGAVKQWYASLKEIEHNEQK